MFDNKKDAEEHDKMLELAANITTLIEQELTIDEQLSEAIGLLLAKRRETLAKACKGRPELLLEADDAVTGDDYDDSDGDSDGKVARLAASR